MHTLEIQPGGYTEETYATLLRQMPERLHLGDAARKAIQDCRDYLERKIKGGGAPIYGINTGFGAMCNTIIEHKDLEALQVNLIRSHSCGMGDEVPSEVVRLMILLKVVSLSYGHSGVRVATVERLIEFYNLGVTPVVYTQGSLGASGDLAPLAHLCLPLIGEGEAWYKGRRLSGAELLAEIGGEPLTLASKEGLALLNGTQFMLAYGTWCIARASSLADLADEVAALSLEAFDGRPEPFMPALHAIRAHAGQVQTAANMRRCLEGSEIAAAPKSQVQDPYSFRCVPQVHGASRDAIAYAQSVFFREFNSVSDNPNIFIEEDTVVSGGNFHGQPLALALDFLAIALAELGSISERRVFQLLSGTRGLPPFLVDDPGLHSGLMITQYTAASIASQNKQLCTPSSVDTIPSSNGQEDHVSMGANAAVKCRQVTENLETLLGIELMNASQAMRYREGNTSPVLAALLVDFREKVPVVTEDRVLSTDIHAAAAFLRER